MDDASGGRPLVFLIAGEPSGDVLGARLMAALKARSPKPLTFMGIGGPQMAAEGLASLFPMDELSLMGAAEILPHLPRLLRRIGETADTIRDVRPDAVVTIDAPAFVFRVAKRLRGSSPHGEPGAEGRSIPLIHYVAPQVWAWKAHRAREIAALLDHLLALLPFEPPYFEAEGLRCTFVGHPVVESGAGGGDGARFRADQGVPPDVPVVCVLPGSRRGEVRRLLPVFGRTLELLAASHPRLNAVVPAVGPLAAEIEDAVGRWPVPTAVVTGEQARFDAFAAADAALAASGTVALELALARTPMVIAYRLNPITAFLARRVIRIRYVNLVNLILGRRVVPELLLGDCRPDRLAAEVGLLLDDPAARELQLAGFAQAVASLHAGGLSPSERAADVVLSYLASVGAAPRAAKPDLAQY